MENPKRPRGRPATGLKRNIEIKLRVTQEEYDKIKKDAENFKSVNDYLIHKIIK
ncbi:hypothetical protein KG089_05860 [Carnobacteriaceae bacterium zg-ZUI252]|nr:hypothetical protein [Carnobacteriaceae bacterium zg-ZUI252]MBS4770088.1 hypothetical protein [Carnobacteriaceae bacterium zg-ZUI240]